MSRDLTARTAPIAKPPPPRVRRAAPAAAVAQEPTVSAAVAAPPVEDEPELDDPEVVEDEVVEESTATSEPVRWSARETWHSLSACTISSIVHAIVLIALAYCAVSDQAPLVLQELIAAMDVERPQEDLLKTELDEQMEAAVDRSRTMMAAAPDYGAGMEGEGVAVGGVAGGSGGGAAAMAPEQGLVDQLVDNGISIDGLLADAPPARELIAATPDGALGDPRSIVDDYQQAMDIITQELLWMLSKGQVLVVWAFDQSESMEDDQREIRDRVARVYIELGLGGGRNQEALLTSVTSFGEKFLVHTKKPTGNFQEIRDAIDEVPVDPSGKEMMVPSIGRAIAMHRDFVRRQERQMALIVVTDESGDRETNERLLEQAIAEAKSTGCRVYVLGREAVFGYPYAHMRWLHPQTKRTHWLPIDRGPETAFVEQLQIDGFHRRHDAHPSGFGPYEQTRIARESGGVFFLLPSIETNLVRGEKHRYELEAMRAYVPDMRSRIEVLTDRDDSPMRLGLWQIIYGLNPYRPQADKYIEVRVHFSPQPADFVRQAQEEMAKALMLLAHYARVQKELEKMRSLREREVSPRWQANYDLMYAQVLAYQARIFEYGAYLEWFLKNPKRVPLTKAPNLTMTHWDIRTRKELLRAEKSQPYIDQAMEWLQAVERDHAGTPWAHRAQWERNRGFGVELIEVYEPPYPTPSGPIKPIPKL